MTKQASEVKRNMGPDHKENSKNNKVIYFLLTTGIVLLLVGLTTGYLFFKQYQDKFYQGVFVNDHHLGGLTKKEATKLLNKDSSFVETFSVTLQVDDVRIASTSAQLGLKNDYSFQLEKSFQLGRSGSLPSKISQIVKLRSQPTNLVSPKVFDKDKVKNFVSEVSQLIDISHQEPSAELTGYSITINPGLIGREVETKTITDSISRLTKAASSDVVLDVPVASTGAVLSQDQAETAKTRAKRIINKSLVLKTPESSFLLEDSDLIALLSFPSGISRDKLETNFNSWKENLEREAVDAVFDYNPQTLEVNEFQPHRPGVKLEEEESLSIIKTNITNLEESDEPEQIIKLDLPVITSQPSVTLSQLNDLGINERIGLGESHYQHSIPNRIHNVSHTTAKINGKIIAPGEEFSFVKELGDVSQATGFKQAYIIKGGQTILGDGGGVCQSSTTLFRSAMNAGLPITKRRQHSYRVSYYELDNKPGVDATVYAGEVDLRFVNDTNHHILIYGEADSNNLYMKMELYGTSDGRTAELVDHKTWDYRSPPTPVYIPDATLPPGKTIRMERANPGIKASFKNIVKDKNGNVIREEEFFSNYRPWAAVYRLGV